MEYELLRAFVIALALVNACVIKMLEEDGDCCGSRRRLSSLFVGVATGVIFTVSAVTGALSDAYLASFRALVNADRLVFSLTLVLLISLSRPIFRFFGFERYSTLVFTNSISLGLPLAFTPERDVVGVLISALIYSAFFVPAMLLFSRIRTRIDESESVPCFAGLPVMLLSGGLLSLALSGIAGIVQKVFT